MENNSSCAYKTKKKMANALKELMKNTSFEKITVSDITEKCGVHRQTFYYHFQDRYELLDWLVYNELLMPLLKDLDMENLFDRLYDAFSKMQKDKKFYQSALKVSGNELSRYVNRDAIDSLSNILYELGKKYEIDYIDKNDDVFVAEFIGYGVSGIFMTWAIRGMKESPQEMTDRVKKLLSACKLFIENYDFSI